MDKVIFLKKCEELEEKGAIDEVITLLEERCVADCREVDILYYYGRVLKKQHRFGDALNAYNRVLAIEPEHVKAKAGIYLINSILSIENNLYFENPYTDEGLYDM